MTARTHRLHRAFIDALGDHVAHHSDLGTKPLLVDLSPLEPLRLRIYMYTLVGGVGERARREYKVVLRVPAQSVGSYGTFDHSENRFTTVVGYDADLDVFVLWDASLHPKFTHGSNLQVKDEVVRLAAAMGATETVRVLAGGAKEVIFACQTPDLLSALRARIAATGGLSDGECLSFLI